MGSNIAILFCLCAFLDLFAVLAGAFTTRTRPLTKTKIKKARDSRAGLSRRLSSSLHLRDRR